jgi:hypothetical protein
MLIKSKEYDPKSKPGPEPGNSAEDMDEVSADVEEEPSENMLHENTLVEDKQFRYLMLKYSGSMSGLLLILLQS